MFFMLDFSFCAIWMWIPHGFMVYLLPTKVKRNSKGFLSLLINSPGRVLSDPSVCRSMEPNWTNSGTCWSYASSGLSLNTLLVSYKWISLKSRRLFQGYGAFSNELQLSYKTGYEASIVQEKKRNSQLMEETLMIRCDGSWLLFNELGSVLPAKHFLNGIRYGELCERLRGTRIL